MQVVGVGVKSDVHEIDGESPWDQLWHEKDVNVYIMLVLGHLRNGEHETNKAKNPKQR